MFLLLAFDKSLYIIFLWYYVAWEWFISVLFFTSYEFKNKVQTKKDNCFQVEQLNATAATNQNQSRVMELNGISSF